MMKMTMTMMMIERKIICLLLFVLIAGTSYSQPDDFGIWFGLDAKHKLIKNLDVEISGCLRTFDNSSRIEQSFVEGGLEYDFTKHLSVAGSYRLVSKLENDSRYYYRHKLFLDLKASSPAGRFTLSARARFQRAAKTFIEDEEDLLARYYTRLKLKALFRTPSFPLNPYIYGEGFAPVSNSSGFNISKYRLAAGTAFKITGKVGVETEYIFQRQYQPHLSNEHILSVSLNFKF
jgi:hypothetical protein